MFIFRSEILSNFSTKNMPDNEIYAAVREAVFTNRLLFNLLFSADFINPTILLDFEHKIAMLIMKFAEKGNRSYSSSAIDW